jgi:monofunctional biosynthetic peptidoglycan transglycosylase
MARVRRQKRARGAFLRGLRRLLLIFALMAALGPPLWVGLYRVVPPPITILMIERLAQGRGLEHRWVPIGRIAPDMVRAVVASEDSRFCQHHGFDVRAIDAALRHNAEKPDRIRGGSTISQQTAKNVFLWPERSWVRKGAEAWFTVLIETIWGKRRIMEVYLNTVEMGPGVYGVEAASQRYFHQPASRLTSAEAGRLAAVLPSPLKWQAAHPGPYVRRRSGRIEARSDTVARAGLAGCVLDRDESRPVLTAATASAVSRSTAAISPSGV